MKKKKLSIVYAVIQEGEVIFACEDEEFAEAFAENRFDSAIKSILEEQDIDDPDEEDISNAAFKAGYDGDHCEVEMLDLSGLTEDDEVKISDGTFIDVYDIYKVFSDAEY